MIDARTFEMYLLSRMRATAEVDAALARLGGARDGLAAAARAAEDAGFEVLGHRAQLYRDVLGAPHAEHADDTPNLSGRFAGSRALRFRLSSWPDLDFVVREDPQGLAWGVAFARFVT